MNFSMYEIVGSSLPKFSTAQLHLMKMILTTDLKLKRTIGRAWSIHLRFNNAWDCGNSHIFANYIYTFLNGHIVGDLIIEHKKYNLQNKNSIIS